MAVPQGVNSRDLPKDVGVRNKGPKEIHRLHKKMPWGGRAHKSCIVRAFNPRHHLRALVQAGPQSSQHPRQSRSPHLSATASAPHWGARQAREGLLAGGRGHLRDGQLRRWHLGQVGAVGVHELSVYVVFQLPQPGPLGTPGTLRPNAVLVARGDEAQVGRLRAPRLGALTSRHSAEVLGQWHPRAHGKDARLGARVRLAGRNVPRCEDLRVAHRLETVVDGDEAAVQGQARLSEPGRCTRLRAPQTFVKRDGRPPSLQNQLPFPDFRHPRELVQSHPVVPEHAAESPPGEGIMLRHDLARRADGHFYPGAPGSSRLRPTIQAVLQSESNLHAARPAAHDHHPGRPGLEVRGPRQ